MPRRGAVRARLATVRVAGLVLWLCAGACLARDPIYKCAGTDGAIQYRDTPCPAGTGLPAPRVDPGPAYPPPQPPAASAATPASAAVATGHAAPALPTPPPPQLYACERYDGQERYVTDDPVPRRYQVPLWAVMSDADRMGAAYTWVEDRCRAMTLPQQCAHWNARRGEIGPRRRLAFRDELARLDAELAELRRVVDAYCG